MIVMVKKSQLAIRLSNYAAKVSVHMQQIVSTKVKILLAFCFYDERHDLHFMVIIFFEPE